MTRLFAEFDDDKISTIARKMNKATDSYSKMNVLEEYGIGWGDRRAALWEIVRMGAYEAWDDPMIWGELAQNLEHASADDVVDFLSKIEHFDEQPSEDGGAEAAGDTGYDDGYDDYGYDDGYGGYEEPLFESSRLVSFWPLHLDTMAMFARHADPELFESKLDDFSAEIQKGLTLVRRRFGDIGRDELPAETVDELARTAVWNGLPWSVREIVDGELVEATIGQDDDEGRAARRRFLDNFVDPDDWGAAVLDAVFLEDYGPNFGRTRPAWPFASVEQIGEMVGRISLHGKERVAAYDLILERDDDPAELVAEAAKLNEGSRWHQSELLAIAATLRAKALGEAPPAGALDLIGFRALDSSSKRADYVGLPYLIEALRHHGEDAAQEQFLTVFGREYNEFNPFPALKAFPDNETIMNVAFDALEQRLQKDNNFSGLNKPAHGLALLGAPALEGLVERYDSADDASLRNVIRRGILGILADAEEPLDAAYDRFISVTDLDDPKLSDDRSVGYYLLPDFHAALQTLPSERAEAIVSRELDAEDKWERVLGAVKLLDNPQLLDKAFGVLAARGLPAKDGYDFTATLFEDYEYRKKLEPYVGPALAASDSPEFHNLVKGRFGEETYDRILAEAGGTSSADRGPADKLRRVANELFESRPQLDRTVLYVFTREDEPPSDGSLNRIGGRPFGVSPDDWPLKNDDDDEPMEHLVTLDLETVPALRARFKDHIRGFSLFVRNPNHNSAWSPGNADAEVRLVTADSVDEFEGELPAGGEEAVGFTVDEVEVPLEAWTVEYGTDPELERVRSQIYGLNAWVGGGGPIWLQGADYHGMQVMQFDEGFVHMNLGDSGIMYVFPDTAFWQCH